MMIKDLRSVVFRRHLRRLRTPVSEVGPCLALPCSVHFPCPSNHKRCHCNQEMSSTLLPGSADVPLSCFATVAIVFFFSVSASHPAIEQSSIYRKYVAR
jgi:hypothetical protein